MKILVLFVMFAFYSNCFAQGSHNELLKNLQHNILPLAPDTPNLSAASSRFLSSSFDQTRLIGLGEATHGTHEFQQAKFLMIKYLITDLHYNTIAMEANFSECTAVNNYIISGKGDPLKALAAMRYWMWNTEEFLNLINWLRDLNQRRKAEQQVRFFGMDMQSTRQSVVYLADLLQRRFPEYYNDHSGLILSIDLDHGALGKNRLDSTEKVLQGIRSYLSNKQQADSAENQFALQHLRVLEQDLTFRRSVTRAFKRMELLNSTRDGFMAENIGWILNYGGPSNKVIIWAHNMHIAKVKSDHGCMGALLEKKYGRQYYALGLEFDRGSFNAVNNQTKKIQEFNFSKSLSPFSGLSLAEANLPVLFIDIGSAQRENDLNRIFFTKKRKHREIGWSFDYVDEDRSYTMGSFDEMYDGLIFVAEAHATKLLKKHP